MISLQNIHKSFGDQKVLEGLDLKVHEGQTQVLLGLSGSGKTTTLRLINSLEKRDRGEITIMGKNLSDHHLIELRRKIGYVIQQAGLFPHYTVAENIAVVPSLLKWQAKTIRKRSAEILEKLHLDPEQYFNKYPSELSGGEKQRIGLARALAADPPILLMDEPFGALDPITRHKIRQEFINLDELKDKTVVLVTHDVREAFELGDSVAVMDQGKILQNQAPAKILSQPANNMVSGFIENDLLSLKLIIEGQYHRANEALLKSAENPNWNKILGYDS